MTWPTTSRAVQPWQGEAADQSLTPSTTDEKSATALRYLSLFVLMGAHSSARAAEPPGSRSSFPDRTEHRLDVEDGCAVDGFEVSHPDPRGLDLHDLDLVQSDRVRPGGRPGVEDTLEGSRGVSPWMHLEHAAVGPIEPSQHDHHVARRQTTHRRAGDLVLKTPWRGREVSPRGCTSSTPRSARSSQVSTITTSPGDRPRIAGRRAGSRTRQASGAPSSP